MNPDLELHILGTNYQSGGVISFSNKGLLHYRDGRKFDDKPRDELLLETLHMRLRDAVAASAAFPPFLPPVTITRKVFTTPPPAEKLAPLLGKEIGDGGIRDNLGAAFYSAVVAKDRTATNCIVSDAGFLFDWTDESAASQSLTSWFNRLSRVTDIQMHRLWGSDLQRLREMAMVSMGTWEEAPPHEADDALPHDQPLPIAPANLAARRPTDLVPLSHGEAYALIRLGYDAAERSLKTRLNLLPRSGARGPAYWKAVLPPEIIKLDKETKRKGMSLTEHLEQTLRDRIADANEAIDHLPVSNSERRVLRRVAWAQSRWKRTIAAVCLGLAAIFVAGLLWGRRSTHVPLGPASQSYVEYIRNNYEEDVFLTYLEDELGAQGGFQFDKESNRIAGVFALQNAPAFTGTFQADVAPNLTIPNPERQVAAFLCESVGDSTGIAVKRLRDISFPQGRLSITGLKHSRGSIAIVVYMSVLGTRNSNVLTNFNMRK